MTSESGIGARAFFREFLANPRYVASAVPSSRALAALMVRELPARGPIVELGPGSGVFTHAMLERGVDEADLHLVERHPDFARRLTISFPRATVHHGDAGRLPALFGHMRIEAMVSGLPLLSLPRATTYRILEGAFRLLVPGGSIIQFTYGPKAPVPPKMLKRLNLKADFVGATLLNLPPARVYRIRRADEG
ncbi:class I SAM-dependent methyltransferase [Frigidibacter sp. MR17.24]|uniref:class I SAM-dependent methyltransferase n=1 Tax=Frigidibacter sp. MR17.24 TaxID=3127345 RepID=UPI003012AB4A